MCSWTRVDPREEIDVFRGAAVVCLPASVVAPEDCVISRGEVCQFDLGGVVFWEDEVGQRMG